MKKALLKDSLKEIKNTYKRFISILLMAFLGVGFFAGLRASSPDMVDTIDKYYDSQNVYDIQVLSTLGLKDKDIEEISKVENVEKAQGSYETDGKIEIDNKEVVTKVITLGELNEPILLDGNMPQNQNECVVEKSFLNVNNKKIGDIIQVEIEDTTNDDAEKVPYLKEKEIKIVGTVQSPLYISRDRGTSKLGAGKVNYYIYIPKENINANDVYTSVYVQVKEAKKYKTSSKQYEDYINETKNKIEEIKDEREQARHDELVNKAQEKVSSAEDELNKQKKEAEQKISDAEKEINDGKDKIQTAEAELNSNTQKADKEFANAQKEIDNAKKTLNDKEQELIKKEEEANKKFEDLEKQKQELQNNLSQVESGLDQVNIQYNSVLELLKNPSITEEQKQMYEAQKVALEGQIQSLTQNKQQIETGINRN